MNIQKDLERNIIEEKSLVESYLLGNDEPLNRLNELEQTVEQKVADLENMFYK